MNTSKQGDSAATGRRPLFFFITVVFSLLVLEVVSAVGLVLLRELRPERFVHGFVDSHFDAIPEDHLPDFLEHSYDRELGWTNKPSESRVWTNSIGEDYTVTFASDGSRANSHEPKPIVIRTYGDSFTWCDEVSDDETWQYHLEAKLGVGIANFGVGGYGTAQALMRFKNSVAEGAVAPITILGIMEENVNRAINSFRPFYNQQTGMLLGFKPYYSFSEADGVTLHKNPFAEPDLSLEDLRELAHSIADDEYWVNQRNQLSVEFPFSFQLVRAVYRFSSDKIRYASSEGQDAIEAINLWEAPIGNAVMRHIIADFVTTATSAGSEPVVLFFPKGETVRLDKPAKYRRFIEEVGAIHPGLTMIDITEHEFDESLMFIRPYDGHFSQYGNSVVADVLEEFFKERLDGYGTGTSAEFGNQ